MLDGYQFFPRRKICNSYNQLFVKYTGVTVNIHSPKKALPSTYLLVNKYSTVFFSQNKKIPGSVYLPVNK